jgi:sulfite reductase alpha subunit-like flavoprotein
MPITASSSAALFYNDSWNQRMQPQGFSTTAASSRTCRLLQSRSFASVALPLTEQTKKPISILYASQGGTAQLFAMQLANRLEEEEFQIASVAALSDVDPGTMQQRNQANDDTLYVFIVSTAGVGEPPDNGRTFIQRLLNQDSLKINYVMFGLGNSKAHSSNYCQFAKDLEKALQRRGADAILPLTLGDDGGDSIEDDFDKFQENLVQTLRDKEKDEPTDSVALDIEAKNVATSSFSRGKTAFPDLHVQLPEESSACLLMPRDHLMDVCRDFYPENAALYTVLHNGVIRSSATSSGTTNLSAMREMRFQTNGEPYETGDHVIVYPQNNDTLVESYLNVIEECPDPNAILTVPDAATNSNKYPHPTGISLYDTLRHCVDLQAVPNPSFARFLTGNQQLNYKEDIAIPRPTALELLLQSPDPRILLKDLLYQLPRLSPRYYSIASSKLVHPRTIYLTYRPVNYITTRGVFRQGVSTGYMSRIAPGQKILAAIRNNPLFRLPNNADPIIMIGGGCGIAPIRAFLEELIYNAKSGSAKKNGKVMLFLGFRNPGDEVYQEIVAEAESLEILETKFVTFNTGCVVCSLLSDAITLNGADLYRLMVKENANVYVCGGARFFGVAIHNAFLDILQKEGKMDEQQATTFLKNLVQANRYHEDLSD